MLEKIAQFIKSITRPVLSWALVIALIAFTAKGIVPAEVFVPIAVLSATYWFQERSREKEIDRLSKRNGLT